jgi:ABC-2 type transport system permease protein
VNALRGLLIGALAGLVADFGVLLLAAVLGVLTASSLLGRPAR